MITRNPEVEDFRARLARLEKRNRWLQGAAVVVLILAGTGLLMGSQAPSLGRAMEAECFILRDSSGRERAWLGLDHGQPVLRFLNTSKREHAALELADEGIILRVRDSQGRLRTGLSLEKEGVALVTRNQDGQWVAGENAIRNHAGRIIAPADPNGSR
jgi:hypothetical protein